MGVIRKEYSVPSKSGIADIYARCWLPEDKAPTAIFQIAHGMAEHGERYSEFAEYLCEKGFAVIADDHIGHGKSVKSDDGLGYFGEENGWDTFVEDEKSITDLMRKEYPGIPVIFFGHSMGSFIAREYIRRYGKEINAAVICGTSGKNPASAIAIRLAEAIAKIKGSTHRSKFIDKIAFGSYNGKINNPRTAFDWLTRDEKIVDEYIADKYCGFLFTAKGYKDLFTILDRVSGKDWFSAVSNELPLLITAGEADPVGAYGKGIRQVYNDLIESGQKDVTLKLYSEMRHEILNEFGKEQVYEDIAAWTLSKIG